MSEFKHTITRTISPFNAEFCSEDDCASALDGVDGDGYCGHFAENLGVRFDESYYMEDDYAELEKLGRSVLYYRCDKCIKAEKEAANAN